MFKNSGDGTTFPPVIANMDLGDPFKWCLKCPFPLFLKKKAQKKLNFGKNRFPDAADFLTNDWMNRKENIEHSCIYTFIE